ncbi:uncharacterized protein B0H18DRAFT_116202 [Fomitopsis serialis]|uniref:uncharacterized protein n=1 Tax=Fomitopsis serialis TaxID=139415 RepID=UPI002007A256|nr:uncharacterized protein B0H18DRAFT_116202 [Neoantrodia serialis]KAH9930830.1 hypothetical protein B0H18DRAFT_116202 [Neoantrodia serialis]
MSAHDWVAVPKWAPGNSFGPVLTQTDLYLLENVSLELHPILAGEQGSFQLSFNLSTGQTGGFNFESRDRDLPFTAKDEPATLPRIDTLIIITEISPWCTVVKNPAGVTLNDVCTTLWREYSDTMVTDDELSKLHVRNQDAIKRYAAAGGAGNTGGWSAYYSAQPTAPQRLRRADWLREFVYFKDMSRKDHYAKQRLGYAASNIFVLSLSQY